MNPIRVGTASWTDRTLLASGWYPEGCDTAADRLAYYASRFDLVEVDATYYAPPAESTAALWAERTPAGFTFNVKAFSLLTQHPTRPGALYKNLRDRLGGTVNARNLYLKDLPPDVVDEVWDRFLAALEPLRAAGKLGALLFQFPRWFPIGARNREYLLRVRERCAPDRICVEFRNPSWLAPENRDGTLGFLTDHRIPYVVVDMPQGHPDSVPPLVAATADLAVVRFHGHSAKWTSRDIQEKYDYRYSEAELADWAPRLRGLAAHPAVRETHVLMNNCCRDHAQRNAAELAALLAHEPVSRPPATAARSGVDHP